MTTRSVRNVHAYLYALGSFMVLGGEREREERVQCIFAGLWIHDHDTRFWKTQPPRSFLRYEWDGMRDGSRKERATGMGQHHPFLYHCNV